MNIKPIFLIKQFYYKNTLKNIFDFYKMIVLTLNYDINVKRIRVTVVNKIEKSLIGGINYEKVKS